MAPDGTRRAWVVSADAETGNDVQGRMGPDVATRTDALCAGTREMAGGRVLDARMRATSVAL